MVGTQADITEQRHNAQAASEAAARLDRIALHVPGVLCQIEMDAKLRPRCPYLSEQARSVLGLDPAQATISSRAFMERIDAADLPHLFEPFNRLAQAQGGSRAPASG